MNPFLEALKVLDERGWYQGSLEGPDGSVCMYGALRVALHGEVMGVQEGKHPPGFYVLLRTVLGNGLIEGRSVAEWNDDPLRTEEDVRLKLKEMAVRWEELHEPIS